MHNELKDLLDLQSALRIMLNQKRGQKGLLDQLNEKNLQFLQSHADLDNFINEYAVEIRRTIVDLWADNYIEEAEIVAFEAFDELCEQVKYACEAKAIESDNPISNLYIITVADEQYLFCTRETYQPKIQAEVMDFVSSLICLDDPQLSNVDIRYIPDGAISDKFFKMSAINNMAVSAKPENHG